jgi:hypothetical protein
LDIKRVKQELNFKGAPVSEAQFHQAGSPMSRSDKLPQSTEQQLRLIILALNLAKPTGNQGAPVPMCKKSLICFVEAQQLDPVLSGNPFP